MRRTPSNVIKFSLCYSFACAQPHIFDNNKYDLSDTYTCKHINIIIVMVDQFAYYAGDTDLDRVCLSLDEDDADVATPGRLRLYGEASGSDAELVGVSYNAATRWNDLDRGKHQKRLDVLTSIAEDGGVPGIWIGETNGKFGAKSDNKEIGKVSYNGSISCSPMDVGINELAQEIRNAFNSDVTPPKSGQTYTTEAIDGFQDWAQDSLGLVTIDIDILGLNKDGTVHSLTEIKRTGFKLEGWYPFTKGKRNDMRNYNLQINTSHRIGARPLLINHPKTGLLGSTDKIYLYDLDGSQMNTVRKQGTKDTFTDNRFSYNRTKITCEDALSVITGNDQKHNI